MGAGSMPEVGRGVQLQRAIFVSYCQKEGGGKPAFKINLTPMGEENVLFMAIIEAKIIITNTTIFLIVITLCGSRILSFIIQSIFFAERRSPARNTENNIGYLSCL